jgi:GntR family transcriptional regulator
MLFEDSLPKYAVVARNIKQQIDEGAYQPGDYLPSEKELGHKFKVSRSTIRQAVAELREAGMLEVVQGIGTRVVDPRIVQMLDNDLTFTDVVRSQDLTPTTVAPEARMVPANTKVAQELEVEVGEPVFKVVRTRYADGKVVCIQTSYLPEEYEVDKERLEEIKSLYAYLEETHEVIIQITRDTITAEAADPECAEVLEIRPGTPILVMKRTAYSSDHKPVEFAESFIRSDRLEYQTTVYRKGKS